MNRFLIKTLLSAVVCFSLATEAIGSENTAVTKLSPKLKSLLNSEMQAIRGGMQSMFQAYISGQYQEVAKTARQIKQSYIIKRNITPEQRQELMSKLPKGFFETDQAFHQYAGMLAHVAEEQHQELIGFYLSKMTEACVSCHSRFATHKFPDFAKSQEKAPHH